MHKVQSLVKDYKEKSAWMDAETKKGRVLLRTKDDMMVSMGDSVISRAPALRRAIGVGQLTSNHSGIRCTRTHSISARSLVHFCDMLHEGYQNQMPADGMIAFSIAFLSNLNDVSLVGLIIAAESLAIETLLELGCTRLKVEIEGLSRSEVLKRFPTLPDLHRFGPDLDKALELVESKACDALRDFFFQVTAEDRRARAAAAEAHAKKECIICLAAGDLPGEQGSRGSLTSLRGMCVGPSLGEEGDRAHDEKCVHIKCIEQWMSHSMHNGGVCPSGCGRKMAWDKFETSSTPEWLKKYEWAWKPVRRAIEIVGVLIVGFALVVVCWICWVTNFGMVPATNRR